MTPRTLLVAAAAAVALLVGACGGESKPGPAAPAGGSSAARTTSLPKPAKAAAKPLTQTQVLGLELGTRRADIAQVVGRPLAVGDYALNASDRRACDFYPQQGPTGVSYDNVWRFCFAQGKLVSVSTAPSRKAAGPDAGAPSPKHAGSGLTKIKKD